MKRFGPPRAFNESNVILVTNIPATQNAISTVFSYFKKYGHISSLWVDGTEATIVYDSKNSARKAYEDPNAFLNNRFIKVGYFNGKNPANIKQFIDEERVEKFSQQVESNYQEIIRNTEEIRRQLIEKNAQNRQQEGQFVDTSNVEEKIELLKQEKDQLILEEIKSATNPEEGVDLADMLQGYRERIQKIQEKIDELENGRLEIQNQVIEAENNDKIETNED